MPSKQAESFGAYGTIVSMPFTFVDQIAAGEGVGGPADHDEDPSVLCARCNASGAESVSERPMTSLTLSRRLTMPHAGRAARRGALLGFFGTLVIGLLAVAGASLAVAAAHEGEVMPRVRVAGVQIAGLDRGAAEARLRAALPSLSSGHATLVVGDQERAVQYAEIGRGYELEAMLDAAFSVARGGNPLDDGVVRLRSLFFDTSLPVSVHAYDAAAIDTVATEIAEQFSRPSVDARVIAEKGVFIVHEATAGSQLDAGVVRSALAAYATTADPADTIIRLEATPVLPATSTADATALAEQARAIASDLTLALPGADDGETTHRLAAATIRGWISFGPVDGSYAITVDEKAASAAIEALSQEIDREPTNASYTFGGGRIGGVTPGQAGRELKVTASVTSLLAALQKRAGGSRVPEVKLAVTLTDPDLTTGEAEAALASIELVSSWTTYYTPEPGNNFGANINIGAFDLDGRVLAPGEWFSFWNSIGPVTLERGYGLGGVIIGGRSVAGGAIGGGICSTSTTLFNAALRAGLEMGERDNHFYFIPRYPTGLDATVYQDDSWQQDMTFRNDTDYPIIIRGYGGNGAVTFELWSVPNGRQVVLSDPVISNQRTAADTTQVSADLAPGTSKRVEYPHDGLDVYVSRTVYGADGNVLHVNEYFSSYGAVSGVTLVGPTPVAPAAVETPAPTPAPSSSAPAPSS